MPGPDDQRGHPRSHRAGAARDVVAASRAAGGAGARLPRREDQRRDLRPRGDPRGHGEDPDPSRAAPSARSWPRIVPRRSRSAEKGVVTVTTCEDVRAAPPRLRAGLAEADADELDVRRHLRGCGACRRELDALQDGLRVFGSTLERPAPPELHDRVMDVLSEEWADETTTRGTRARTAWLADRGRRLALARGPRGDVRTDPARTGPRGGERRRELPHGPGDARRHRLQGGHAPAGDPRRRSTAASSPTSPATTSRSSSSSSGRPT